MSEVIVHSTRGNASVPLWQAIATGQATDGGLYMPPGMPRVQGAGLQDAGAGDLPSRALALLRPVFQGDRLEPSIADCVAESFTFAAPLRWVDDCTALLELFHGPTAAFKDFGARFLAACLQRLRPTESPTTVLVATSGDTGAAVASAFWRRPGLSVAVLYPNGRVSERQAHQLGAFGDNVHAFCVDGSFDDCQRLVKQAFADSDLTARFGLVSANSISLGRLLPQMAYYVDAALSVAALGRGPANFIVPTGNLGNALACLLVREAGLPIGRVVLATNQNRVVPDFLQSGEYRPTASIATLANAMDVGAPSNLERLQHRYADPASVVEADWVDDDAIRATIERFFLTTGIVVCPHTACGIAVLQRLRQRGESATWIVAATAHPAKFASIVEPLVGAAVPVPASLAQLLCRPASATPLLPEVGALTQQLAAIG